MAVLTSQQVCELLGIKPNNLYQIRHRKQLNWVKKEGQQTFYALEEVEALKMKRDSKSK